MIFDASGEENHQTPKISGVLVPLIALSFRTNARDIQRQLSALEKKQLPFAQSQTANRLARQGIADIQAEERRVFDRPTPYALNAFYWTKATKRSPTATILAKDGFGKGTPAWKFLDPEAFGGERRMKRFERALEATLGTGFSVPGRGASLNQYGNISEADINRLMSAMGAFGEQGYRANRGALTAAQRNARKNFGEYKKAQYFLGHVGHDGNMLAIYQIVGTGQVVPVLVFPTKRPTYRVRLPYRETVARTVSTNAQAFLGEEMAKAIATTKPG